MTPRSANSQFATRKNIAIQMQTEVTECGLACVAMIASYYGYETDLASLRRRFGTSLKGVTLTRIIQVAHEMGLEARPLKTELAYLTKARTPCILHWGSGHFVVMSHFTRKRVEILDPAKGRYRMSQEEASKYFTGVLVELTPSLSFSPAKEKRQFKLRDLIGRAPGLLSALLQLLAFALLIELFALAIPLQMQWIVDNVLVTGDTGLVGSLTVAFTIVLALQLVLTLTRAWMISWLGASLNSQWHSNLFGHLLRLPLDYFQKRQVGDIASRFFSLQTFQDTLTTSIVTALLDGLMGLVTLSVLALYSWGLTVVVLSVAVSYALLRLKFYPALHRASEEQLVYASKQQSTLLESIRGVQAIKIGNKESERKARLSNQTIEAMRRTMKTQRMSLTFAAVKQSLASLQRLAVVAVSASLVIRGSFSAGMLVAVVSYSDQLFAKVASLIDKSVEFRILRLHAERIADIALTQPEEAARCAYSGPIPEPRLDLHNLSFRYADGEPWVLSELNLTIHAGESIAIVGPSGSGKSTLSRLLLGLIIPSEGRIEIGRVDIRHFGIANYRRLIGAVMQDDSLFAGTIADNISFFDPSATIEQVMDAATLASVHTEIAAMPMGYETLVGDMGSALSGGQKQRILLARALFNQPKILILDEATSHLDSKNESIINANIRGMKMTRIIFAHRAETIASADRKFELAFAVRPVHALAV